MKKAYRNVLMSLLLFFVALFFLRRAALFFLPFFVVFPFWFSRDVERFGEGKGEDPADWWKKGKAE